MAVSVGEAPAVAFKGRMMALTVLEIRSADHARVAADLAAHLARAGDFFRGTPVLLALDPALAGQAAELSALAALLREQDLLPVAVIDGDREAARAAGLGVVADVGAKRAATGDAPADAPDDAPSSTARTGNDIPAPGGAALLVNKPVRSGRQIYARNSDLIVTAAVSEGAEVIADGHIHIYGALRGRALAGASGDPRARIFCDRFEADLVAVAGCYQVADHMPAGVRGKRVQVRLDGDGDEGSLIIEAQEQ